VLYARAFVLFEYPYNIMKYSQLIRLLVARELTLRYKRSVIGIGWTLLNPMLTSFVLWVVFSFAFGNQLIEGQQFAPYLMAGILMNTFFSQGIVMSADSISRNGGVLTKIKVPPQIFAVSTSISAFINFLIGLFPLAIVVFVSGQSLAITLPLVILVGGFLTLLVTGIGLMCSIIFIRFDDTRNIVNVLLMILMYLTPILYPISILNATMQRIVSLNPLTSYLDIFRWAFSNNASPTFFNWVYMATSSLFVFFIGICVFRKFWPKMIVIL
jgi:ABC-2 type transport system permease protein